MNVCLPCHLPAAEDACVMHASVFEIYLFSGNNRRLEWGYSVTAEVETVVIVFMCTWNSSNPLLGWDCAVQHNHKMCFWYPCSVDTLYGLEQ